MSERASAAADRQDLGRAAGSVGDPDAAAAKRARMIHALSTSGLFEPDFDLSSHPVIQAALSYIEQAPGMPRGEGYYMMAKRALAASLGIAEGFAVYRILADRPDHAELQLKRLASLREIAQNGRGAFHRSAPSEPFVVPPPVVVGEGGVGPLAALARPLYVACLINARVRAGSDVIEADDLAVVDQETEEHEVYRDEFDSDPAVFQETDEGVWLIAPPGAAASVDIDEAFTLLGRNLYQFGHLIFEFIAKYIAAVLSGALPRVPVLIEAGLPETYRQALDLLVAGSIEIIELPRLATARVRRLWCAPVLSSFPVPDAAYPTPIAPPARYAPVAREMARRADRGCAEPTGVELVFLAREPPGPRALVNQAAILAASEARGFQAIYPNRLAFVDQVRFMRHARFVVGPSGGAMMLTMFLRPGSKLCAFRYSGDVFAAQADMTGLQTEIGIDVTVFTGRCARMVDAEPWNSDYEIDTAAFCRFLDQWLQL